MMMRTDRPRGQQGASLMVVLAFMTFVAAIVPAVLGMVFTGLRVTEESTTQRVLSYAAESGVHVAVAAAVEDPGRGGRAGECAETTVIVGDASVRVSCAGHPGLAEACGPGSRVIEYLAEASRGEDVEQVAAQVVYQDLDGAQQATVTGWDATVPAQSQVASRGTGADESPCGSTVPVDDDRDSDVNQAGEADRDKADRDKADRDKADRDDKRDRDRGSSRGRGRDRD